MHLIIVMIVTIYSTCLFSRVNVMLLVPHCVMLQLESVYVKLELEVHSVNAVMLDTSIIHLLAAQCVLVG